MINKKPSEITNLRRLFVLLGAIRFKI